MTTLAKLKRFPISELALLSIFTTGNEIHVHVDAGFPLDAVIVRHYYDRVVHSYFLVVQSETFDAVKNGEPIPFGIVVVHDVRPQQKNPPEHKESEVEKGAKEATSETQTNVRAGA